ncbi:hypothetical protein COI44_14255 [Bacillus sp. AFS088145]|nr:hypothetical protein COI44_14255 [Bacillus sp. AFS088145]
MFKENLLRYFMYFLILLFMGGLSFNLDYILVFVSKHRYVLYLSVLLNFLMVANYFLRLIDKRYKKKKVSQF